MRKLLMTCLLAATPMTATAQSEATCVAYMEADAIYAEKERKARALSKEARKMADDMMADMIGRGVMLGIQMTTNPVEKRIILADVLRGLTSEQQARLNDAFERVQTIEGETLDEAKDEKRRAYLSAYRGETSNVEAVMNSLVHMDRERCRAWYGQ